MTRETKIGLLVGLAFIIVIGILLSDHMSSSTEPPQASVTGAGGNVREGVTTPAGEGLPPVGVTPPPADAPRSPVPTRADLNRPPVSPVGLAKNGNAAGNRARGPAPVAPDGFDDRAPRPGDPRELVLQHPDDFAPVGPTRPAIPVTAPRTYKAEAGDSLSRIAAKAYGANTKTARDLIVKANPSLGADGSKVVIGKVYVLPNLPASAPAGAVAAAPPAAPAPRAAARPAADAAAGTVWYTVKENDSLWGIAKAQLGTGTAWEQIRELNPDVLGEGTPLRANMRIKLPARGAASASVN